MRYKVEGGVAEIGTDMVLSLSKEQAGARAHALEAVKGGWRPKHVVQFKAGEEIGIDVAHDALPRSLAVVLVPLDGKAKKDGKGKAGLKEDGPTVAEYVAAGHSAKTYPPKGYASRSTDEEIAAAIKAEEA